MVEKIAGITINGRCFNNDTTLKLYPSTNDRISVIYGKNGSGKSTISNGFHSLTLESPVSDIVLNLLDSTDTVLESSDYRDNIFVFNEEYIDRNIKIEDDGLGTIVLLGEQLDFQTEIDKHTTLEEERKSDWEKEWEKLNEYQDKSSPLSPEYHLDKIRRQLKVPGGWSETDSKIKGNKQNTAVRDDVLEKICTLTPSDTFDNLRKRFDEKQLMLSKISDNEFSFSELSCTEIQMDNGLEKKVCGLLSKTIEKTVLTEREKLILMAIQSGRQNMIEESKKTFSDEETTFCPYCYQPVRAQYKQELLASINRVLNKDVEDHKAELMLISFPFMDKDYSQYENLDSILVKKIKQQTVKCLEIINAYKEKIKQKIENTYIPIIIVSYGLKEEIEKLNTLLKVLQTEIVNFNDVRTKRAKIIKELTYMNMELAHFDVRDIYSDLLKQKKERVIKEKDVEKAQLAWKNESLILKDLRRKQSSIGLAITNINSALEYVFFAKDRLSVELINGKYYLKSNGKDVLPKNISLGERNIVALCYFFTQMMSNQEINKLYQRESFVVIDDPVSSFDFENRVGVLSYIKYQVNCLIKGNQQSKILVLTHDLTTAFALQKAMEEVAKSTKGIAQIQETSFLLRELVDNQLVPFERERNEYEKLLKLIYEYANDELPDSDVVIGNMMRRVLEAFSTFNYKQGINGVSLDKNVLEKLGECSIYFENLMYRLVLNGESHSAEKIYSLRENVKFYEFISHDEKKRTAKDILCFMYLVNPLHIQAYLQSKERAIDNIKQWSEEIKVKSSGLLPSAKVNGRR